MNAEALSVPKRRWCHRGPPVTPWETGTAVAGAGEEEVVADAGIGADSFTYGHYVCPHPVAEPCYLVHEGDAGSEHGVGGVFGHFGAADIHDDHAVLFAHEGVVELFHDFGGADVVTADDDPVRFHEVVYGRPFFEEFWVGYDVEFQVDTTGGQLFLNCGANLVAGADRDG